MRGDLNRARRCRRVAMLRGRKPVCAQSAILDENKSNQPLLLSITAFSVRMCFSSVQKTWLARASAQWPRADIGGRRRIPQAVALELARTAARPRGSPIVHGRKAVRAQSAILDKNESNPPLLLSITAFSVRMCFSSVQKTRLARAARESARGMRPYPIRRIWTLSVPEAISHHHLDQARAAGLQRRAQRRHDALRLADALGRHAQ